VTSVSNPTVEDGDCRYLPKEILNDDYENLTKSDVFSLGLTMYEAVSNTNLKLIKQFFFTQILVLILCIQ